MLKTLIVVAIVVLFLIIVTRIKSSGVTQVSADQARNLLEGTGVLALDVRSPGEYAQGHLKGATLIPVDELSGRLGELGDRKDRKILVYCHAGSRSTRAASLLKAAGFSQVMNLTGGITSWMNRNYAVTRK